MVSIVALGPVTGGINVKSSRAELLDLGLVPGSFSLVSGARMDEIRLTLESKRRKLPEPRGGGSVANTADLIARAGVSCGLIGVGGDDPVGRAFVSHFEKASLIFLSQLVEGEVTGYDFYLYDEDDQRTIVLTHGANARLSPAGIDVNAIQNATLLLIDGSALSYGSQSEAAVVHSIRVAEEADVPFLLTLASCRIVEDYRNFFETHGPQAQMVAGNLEQTAVLVGLAPEATLDEVKKELSQRSINAIVTLDADGVFARIDSDTFLVPTQAIEPLDTTGAGDNFLGAFLVARTRGIPIDQALAVGNFVSGQVIRYDSARLPLDVDIPQLIEKAIENSQK